METISWIPGYLDILIVSEELSSVETITYNFISLGFYEFQKNLVVWKPRCLKAFQAIETVFQKNLVVWKHPKTFEFLRKEDIRVSEELSSVETLIRCNLTVKIRPCFRRT